ncbi:MAG TPA: ATPase, T2SS/T4P/T4SS family, partial [Candidatus Polarisedimenticolaceae bacterium]|nr:ATPase, T2SS/T4P/T4SS family [Candidatus Polarisedimenticolaceae bacterium]
SLPEGVTRELLEEYLVAPLHIYNPQSLELGLTGQTDRGKLPALQAKVPGVKLTFKTISLSGYDEISNGMFYREFEKEREGDFATFGKKLATAAPKQAFQDIAQLAFWLGASDIHIEPQNENARIRFRIDGTLHLITTVAVESYKVFLSDLQTRAEVTWGSDKPQSGRISFKLMNNDTVYQNVNMRLETIPTFHGEEIVVRIFNTTTVNLTLESMGFTEKQTKRLESIITHHNGMVLTVGPTGSGKTSTLYALINRINNTEIKIATLEDPVEYDLPGISQIPVRTEDQQLFAEKLRAVMREDPNVVMIGEIRDIDTAKTALQAALTGHLVLSTFHAANAAAAISRLLDMINQNPLFASAIRLIIAQRLVRRICTHCATEDEPTAEEQTFLINAINELPADRRPQLSKNFKLKHGGGCAICHGLGYKGR